MPPPRPLIAMLAAAMLCGALACAPAAPAQAPAGASLVADPGALLGQVTRLRGVLPDIPAGGAVQIQRLDAARGWVAEATAAADAGGTFVARWRPHVVGQVTVRAVPGGNAVRAAAATPSTPPSMAATSIAMCVRGGGMVLVRRPTG